MNSELQRDGLHSGKGVLEYEKASSIFDVITASPEGCAEVNPTWLNHFVT